MPRVRIAAREVPKVAERILSELNGPNPPRSVPDLAIRVGTALRTVKHILAKEREAGRITEKMTPWSSISGSTEREIETINQYREENTRLREENTKLLAAQGLAAKSNEESLAPHLQQIFRAAGRDLCERVFQIVWPPSAILSAQEASHETEAVAASPPS